MSLHTKPEHSTPAIKEALKAHGMESEKPSMLADGFRLGWAAAVESEAKADDKEILYNQSSWFNFRP